jgi:tRNA(Ile2) C34 agmatinyltransferase TiaS
LVLPLIMVRGLFARSEVNGVCPYCSAPIKTSDATIRLRCVSCGREVAVRDAKLCAVEEPTA